MLYIQFVFFYANCIEHFLCTAKIIFSLIMNMYIHIKIYIYKAAEWVEDLRAYTD